MEKRFKISALKSRPKIIVITGAESTGKSTLTETLAFQNNAPFIPELAREYVENLHKKYTYWDVEKIARMQVKALSKFKDSNSPYIFVDTWLIITKIWFQKVFNRIPEWIDPEIRNTPIDLFLVCNIDLPWIYDPVRENGGEQRKELHNEYIQELENYNFSYNIVSGKEEERIKNALQYLDLLK